MRHERVNYIAVGLFVLVSFVFGFWFLFQLTGSSGAVDRYFATYESVAGLRPGAQVFYQGYPVGRVEAIRPQLEPSGVRYRVDFGIARGWPVPEDSVARVAARGVLGVVALEIDQGGGPGLLEPGDELRSLSGGDLFTVLGETAAEVRLLSRDTLRPMLERLDRRLDSLGGQLDEGVGALLGDARELTRVLNEDARLLRDVLDERNRDNIRASLEHLRVAGEGFREVNTNLNAASLAVRGLSDQARPLFSNDNIDRANRMLEQMEELVGNIHGASGELAQTRARLDRALDQASGALEENRPNLKRVIRDLRVSLDAVSRRMDTISAQVEGTSRNLNAFSRDVRRDPSILLRGDRSGGQ
ncbi:MAG: MlaD family protein [Gammaproteobacteria bacterium]